MMEFGTNSTQIPSRVSQTVSALPSTRAGSVIYSNSSLAVPATTSVLPNGKISATTGVAATGNAFPFVVQGNFIFSSSGSTLTIYWDGTHGSVPFVLRRADNSQISIPKGSLTLTGLTSGIKYGFVPFVSVAQPQTVSFVAGDSGSPRYAFSPSVDAATQATAAQTQRLTANEKVTNGFVYYTLGASADQGVSSSGGNPYAGQLTS